LTTPTKRNGKKEGEGSEVSRDPGTLTEKKKRNRGGEDTKKKTLTEKHGPTYVGGPAPSSSGPKGEEEVFGPKTEKK